MRSIPLLLPHVDNTCISAHEPLQLALFGRWRRPEFRLLRSTKARDQSGVDGIILGHQHLALTVGFWTAWVHDRDSMAALVEVVSESLPVSVRRFHAGPRRGYLSALQPRIEPREPFDRIWKAFRQRLFVFEKQCSMKRDLRDVDPENRSQRLLLVLDHSPSIGLVNSSSAGKRRLQILFDLQRAWLKEPVTHLINGLEGLPALQHPGSAPTTGMRVLGRLSPSTPKVQGPRSHQLSYAAMSGR